jgi:D-alanyl-D-alanine carboxypeptidase
MEFLTVWLVLPAVLGSGTLVAHAFNAHAPKVAGFCSFALICGACSSAPVSGQDYQGIIDHAVAHGMPGVQAYVKRGPAHWEGAAGVSSIEEARPMALTTRLRVASITKMMTYAAILDLVTAGRLRLSDRAVTVAPPGVLDGIPYAGEITIAQLLDHTSGLYNFNGEDGADFFAALFSDPQRGSRSWSAADLLGYAKRPEHSPSGRPGERRSYSSTGYIVLETILERVTGRRFAQVYRERLFVPLGMASAGVEGADFGTDSIAPSYARADPGDRARPSPFTGRKAVRADGLVNLSAGLTQYNGWARGAGAVAASVEDLARFMDAVTAGRVTVIADQQNEFARSKLKPDSYFDWNGGSWGIQATIFFEPYRDITVIVLTNGSNVGPSSHDIARDLLVAAREGR